MAEKVRQMSTEEKYNGWTNRETWAVALHINNDQGWQESVHEALRQDMADDTEGVWNSTRTLRVELEERCGSIIRENVEGVLNPEEDFGHHYVTQVLPARNDIGSLWRVNWTELGSAFLSDLEESS